MRMYFACRDIGNAGDHIGPYLYNKITNKEARWVENFTARHLLVCGSILQHATRYSTVLGAGFGDSNQKIANGQRPNFLIVRGPLTGEKLISQGFKKNWAYGDPGLFLPFVYKPENSKRYNLGVIPHYVDKNKVHPGDYHIIDICKPVEHVIDNISSCEAVISSSLHGIIIAHAYGVPAMWVEFSDNIAGDGFKFRDYFISVGINPYQPLNCRDGIPKNIDISPVEFNINNFRGAFGILKTAVK